jgi:hypothetical protein
MNSATIRNLRESVALLPTEDPGPVHEFYRRLFGLAPEVRPMFNREIGLQARKFSDMLAWVIAHLENPHELSREMRELGARHGVDLDVPAHAGRSLHPGDGRRVAGGLRLHQPRGGAWFSGSAAPGHRSLALARKSSPRSAVSTLEARLRLGSAPCAAFPQQVLAVSQAVSHKTSLPAQISSDGSWLVVI